MFRGLESVSSRPPYLDRDDEHDGGHSDDSWHGPQLKRDHHGDQGKLHGGKEEEEPEWAAVVESASMGRRREASAGRRRKACCEARHGPSFTSGHRWKPG